MLTLLASSLLVALTSASFCGDSAIPYSIEILADGQPILGCARPTCFGWGANGQPAGVVPGGFYKINEHSDGYMRAGLTAMPPFPVGDARFYHAQIAMCETAPNSISCPAINQWVGGIAPALNVSTTQTTLQCCAFDGLLQSEDRGIATLHGGQMAVGGEVFSSGRQIAFDYISNIAKTVKADGSLQYDVAIRRMACSDYGVSAKIEKEGEAAAATGAQAFQAPNFPVNQPLPLPPAGAAGGNQVLEEIVQEEAVQLAPGTQFQPFQPALQPPPFQQPQFIPQPQVVAQPQYVPQYQYSAPVSYGQAQQWCFTGDMTVRTMDGATKRMDELQKQDWVLAVDQSNLEYVPVEFWLHRVPSQEAEFNVFETENGNTIKLTDKHYIFKGDCSHVGTGPVPFAAMPSSAVFADELREGDCLFTLGEDSKAMNEVRIVRATKETHTGIYAPMTATGRIIVNGIHASCHNIMEETAMGHSYLTMVEKVQSLFSSLFGTTSDDVVETPSGLTTLLSIADLVMPKNHVEL